MVNMCEFMCLIVNIRVLLICCCCLSIVRDDGVVED